VLVNEHAGLADIDDYELPYRELPGMSAGLLKNHFALYRGYRNRLADIVSPFEDAVYKEDVWTTARLAREIGFLRNAIALHELYFENMIPGGRGKLSDVIPFEFVNRWAKKFRLLGKASTGWVVLAYDRADGALVDFTMNDHGQGFIADTIPILVMDVYEHAYMPDYGLDKNAYIDAFFRNIDWDVVRERLKAARGNRRP
jgi:Fe-Mn family superoxide dismutase